ncbi:MAG: myristoyl transferase [Chloroflexi bacterium]|jgi:NitT/TauT family transport system substrate-binding protein|uniref:Myristoyl transferase n=1 Tax=Candidatus Thermofonsia Clade 3 bacterium TaxID=2364212 RepID=A0A2M8QDI9_9CHLR|nr:ABC transporter substrate-binding protein [Candidatus Roseilinea sp. NK_OTU-006]PJF47869.1 MAG: myristoyl transferase [Candidatus Thermofonsia Clade 3 bacterium]RMG64003.1 MAG: myristoyl transferase [Chloroflexota bacterium]
MNKWKVSLTTSLLLIVLSACAIQAPPPRTGGPGAPLQKIRLPMGYIPNVQFAPYYVAVERGYFAEAGIELEFDYKFETDGMKLVAAGELPFAVVSGEQVVLARAQGLPVKYFLQWYRRFPIAIFSLKTKGIAKPEDLKGRTVGIPGFFGATYVGWRAFLDANGLSERDMQVQEIGFTQAAAVQQGKVDAAVGYIVNEPLVLEANGFPVNVFRVSDQVDMVANGLVTNEKTLRENPTLVRNMARALLRGIADTIADPNAAMQISAKYVEGLQADDPIQKRVLLATIELMRSERLGISSPQAWENTQNTLLAMGQIKQKLDVNEFFTNEFVP